MHNLFDTADLHIKSAIPLQLVNRRRYRPLEESLGTTNSEIP